MGSVTMLAVAMTAFVGTHLVMSHPLRPALVARLGEGPFLGIYSLVSFITLGWVIWLRVATEPGQFYWAAGPWLWDIGNLLMLLASILLIGSLTGNPAMPDPHAPSNPIPDPRGVFAITRHLMMWSFIIWAIVHFLLWGTAANLIVSGGTLLLALVGALGQDAKKLRLQGERWQSWMARTSFVPFGQQFRGRLPWSAIWPGWPAFAGGLILFVAATWAHPLLGGPVAGIWRWLI